MAKRPTKAQSAAIESAVASTPEAKPPRAAKADAATNGVIAAFKAAYIANKRSERELETAKPLVHHAFAILEADFIESDFGTLVLQQRSKSTTTTSVDHLAIAGELGVDVDKLKAAIAKHTTKTTTTSDGDPAIISPAAWGLEAKAKS